MLRGGMGVPGRLRVFLLRRFAAGTKQERFRFFVFGYARQPVFGPEGDCHKSM